MYDRNIVNRGVMKLRKNSPSPKKHYLGYASGILWIGILTVVLCGVLTCLVDRGRVPVERLAAFSRAALFLATVLGLVWTQDRNSTVIPYLLNGGVGALILLFVGVVIIDGEMCSFTMPFILLFGAITAFLLRKNRKSRKTAGYRRFKNR